MGVGVEGRKLCKYIIISKSKIRIKKSSILVRAWLGVGNILHTVYGMLVSAATIEISAEVYKN